MQIHLSAFLFAAVLALSTATSINLHPEVEQTPTPTFNFWSNLKQFAWGLTLGIPGGHMHWTIERCWYDTDAFFNQIEIAQNNTQA